MSRIVLLLTVVGAVLLSSSTGVLPNKPVQAATTNFTVNSKSDEADVSPGDGTCATSKNACTLRAAIEESNLRAGPDAISFDIPGAGVQTITLGSALPTISDTSGPTTIDGYTQPGSSPNTDPSASNAKIMVQITGPTERSRDGMKVTSSGNTIRGLAFFKLRTSISLFGSSASANNIVGNFVGTDAAGNFAASTKGYPGDGIELRAGAHHNGIGGPSSTGDTCSGGTVADRNVVSGNYYRGVALFGEGTEHNCIVNNIVGLGPAGDKALPNYTHGIDVNKGASRNQIGGTGEGERNVVSGNKTNGVEVSHQPNTVGNKVVGNLIGTDLTGKTGPAYAINGKAGVHVEDESADTEVRENVIGKSTYAGVLIEQHATGTVVQGNRIGISLDGSSIPGNSSGVVIVTGASGSRIGPDNVIANGLGGVRVVDTDTDRNTITGNSIYANQRIGIDLAPLGSTNPNDATDGDSGPNEQLNFPVITGASTGKVSGTACPGCMVEVFLADRGAGAYGAGKAFVGSATADSGGGFAATVSGVAEGAYLTTTATDAQGNTSEFSLNKAATTGSDTTAPTVQPPVHSFATSSTLGTDTVSVKLSWSATDDSGSAITEYRLQQSTNGGAFATVSIPATSMTKTVSLSPENTYQFRVQAKDQAGNWSDWANGSQFELSDHQETSGAVTYAGTWTAAALSTAYGGGVNHASASVARAQFSFTGTSVSWVAPKNADRGKATVWIDGVKVGTVDLYSPTEQPRKMVFTKNDIDSSQPHTMEVRVLDQKNASSSGTRVDIDAFAVLKTGDQ